MPKEWINGNKGKNLKFKRETLLNWATGRWGLNKAYSVGPTSELIRMCSPKTFEEWEKFYFGNAVQKKKNGIKITHEYFEDLGRRLHIRLLEDIRKELESIQEQECIDYIYNLVLNRTYEGYRDEIDLIYGQLEASLKVKIEFAPDKWDRLYNVDFFVKINDKYIGLQIKPIATGKSINDYQWETMHRENHERFIQDFGGKVFFVYSVEAGKGKKRIYNIGVISEIQQEIKRLSEK